MNYTLHQQVGTKTREKPLHPSPKPVMRLRRQLFKLASPELLVCRGCWQRKTVASVASLSLASDLGMRPTDLC